MPRLAGRGALDGTGIGAGASSVGVRSGHGATTQKAQAGDVLLRLSPVGIASRSLYSLALSIKDHYSMRSIPCSAGLIRFIAYFIFLFAGVQQPAFGALALEPAHVDDQAKIFGANRARIESKLIEFEKMTGHKVVVLTRKALGEADTMEVLGTKQFRDLKLGPGDVLFLFVWNTREIRVDSGKEVSDIMNDPEALQSITAAVAEKYDFEDKGLGLERAIDVVIKNLEPGLWRNLVHPRTVPWALLSLALGAGLICAGYLAIKKVRQPL
jgi:hypothetical protein